MAEWAAWMEGHVADHMGPVAVVWMDSYMDVTDDEIARHMAVGGHGGGMYGQGRG